MYSLNSMYLGIKCPLKSVLKIHFFIESFPDPALQIMSFCPMHSKQSMLFTWLLWKTKRISPLFLIMLLVNEPNTVLRDKEGGCYISILLKPHLYRVRFLTERNVPCKEI